MSDMEVEHYDGDSKPKRKRELSKSPTRSPTPKRSPSPPRARQRRSPSPKLSAHPRDGEAPRVQDMDPARKQERERQLAARLAEIELGAGPAKPAFDAQAEFAKLLSSRSGGVYVPPARLRALQAAASEDKSSAEYQRLSWDALRKSITGIVNRVNIGNIKHVIPELFGENLIRGRGLFARSIMKAQAASLPFTPIFAALVAVINTKLPQVGELLLMRLISQFRRSFKRNDKIVCHSTTTFIAHLVNQGVAHEIIALQILVLLLEQPTDDSVEIAVGFMREVGAYLAENSPRANNGVFERFRAVLHEGAIDKRVQYMIEVLFQVRKDKYKDNVIIPEGLDLVEEDDQITHQISLDDELQVQDGLNVFKFDPNFLENEEKYKEIKAEILGEGSDDDESDSSDSDSDSEEGGAVPDKPGIEDATGTNLVNLRRTIYLTIMNALSYEEAVHKLMKVNIQEGQEIELCNMIIECCSQERSYSTFYGLIGERFCKLNRVWCESFEEAYANYYDTIHRYETNRLRNIARFFGHLLANDGISWAVFSVVKINEDDTTSSSRIFIKILMQELQESMGLKTMAERFKDPTMKESFAGMFPIDDPTGKSTRFSINYFTALGLGVLTEEMRTNLLENARKMAAIRDLEAQRAAQEESSSSDSSDTDTREDLDRGRQSGDMAPARGRPKGDMNLGRGPHRLVVDIHPLLGDVGRLRPQGAGEVLLRFRGRVPRPRRHPPGDLKGIIRRLGGVDGMIHLRAGVVGIIRRRVEADVMNLLHAGAFETILLGGVVGTILHRAGEGETTHPRARVDGIACLHAGRETHQMTRLRPVGMIRRLGVLGVTSLRLDGLHVMRLHRLVVRAVAIRHLAGILYRHHPVVVKAHPTGPAMNHLVRANHPDRLVGGAEIPPLIVDAMTRLRVVVSIHPLAAVMTLHPLVMIILHPAGHVHRLPAGHEMTRQPAVGGTTLPMVLVGALGGNDRML